MKTILTGFEYLLFITGTISMLLGFADDNRPLDEWLLVHLGYFALGMMSFAMLKFVSKKKNAWRE